MTPALFAFIGTVFGGGVILVAGGLGRFRLSVPMIHASLRSPDGDPSAAAHRDPRHRRVAVAAACSLVALVITRWPMAVPLATLAVLGGAGLSGGPAKATIERIEAVATWTEMLRDTMAGAAGLTQALMSTAPVAPRALRPQMATLAARLQAGIPLVEALAQVAHDIADPAADMVVACLVMAATERAQRLGDLLGALAESTRAEAAMRLRVEASRASARSAVRMITGFSFGLLGVMAVFAHSYMSPYRTTEGQLVLALVGCIYGLGLWLMAVMARPKVFPRLAIGARA